MMRSPLPRRELPGAESRRCDDDDKATLNRLAGDLAAATQEFDDEIRRATTALDNLGTTCALNHEPTATLAASQTELTVAKDASYVVALSGGRLPLTAGWIGSQPDEDSIGINLVGRNLIVFGRSKLVPGGEPHTLRVSDSHAIPEVVDIAIKVPAAE